MFLRHVFSSRSAFSSDNASCLVDGYVTEIHARRRPGLDPPANRQGKHLLDGADAESDARITLRPRPQRRQRRPRRRRRGSTLHNATPRTPYAPRAAPRRCGRPSTASSGSLSEAINLARVRRCCRDSMIAG